MYSSHKFIPDPTLYFLVYIHLTPSRWQHVILPALPFAPSSWLAFFLISVSLGRKTYLLSCCSSSFLRQQEQPCSYIPRVVTYFCWIHSNPLHLLVSTSTCTFSMQLFILNLQHQPEHEPFNHHHYSSNLKTQHGSLRRPPVLTHLP